jgi:elongation factor 2
MKQAFAEGKIREGRLKKRDEEVWKQLMEYGFDRDEAKSVVEIYKHCIFEDNTKGIVHIGEVIELCLQAFKEVIDKGPLAREPCVGLCISLTDTSLHEDAIHRGPAQVIPAVRDAIKGAMIQAGPVLFEPVQTIRIDTPTDFMGTMSKIVSSRRGQLLDIQHEEASVVAKAKLPVAEMFGFTDTLRSETEGRAFWALQDSAFERLPSSLQEGVVFKIRQRKGLAETQT